MTSTVTKAADASLGRSELDAPGHPAPAQRVRLPLPCHGRLPLPCHGRRAADGRGGNRRIKTLVIPSAWEEVWIFPREDGHIQAVGTVVATNGTFGLATILREHVTCHKNEITFCYADKSGKRHVQVVADDLASPVVRTLKRRRS